MLLHVGLVTGNIVTKGVCIFSFLFQVLLQTFHAETGLTGLTPYEIG